MNLEIQPYAGVVPIEFGMTVDEVRKCLNSPIKPFFKGVNSDFATDAFGDPAIKNA